MKMRGNLAVASCLASVTGAALVFGAAINEAGTSNLALEQQLKESLKTRAESAQLAFEAMQVSFYAEQVTFNDLADATTKLAEAQVAMASKPDEEIAALGRHVERTKQAEAKIKKLFDVGTKGGDAKEYYSAKRERESAEISLLKARIKAR